MRRNPIVQVARGAALVCCLAALALLRPPAAGGALGKHDFAGLLGVAANGSCTACHRPHKADTPYIWSRSLTDEKIYFDQLADPNYAPGDTIACYDCHDNHAATGAVDNDPPDTSFNAASRPQDVAFDDEMNIPPPPYNIRTSLDDDNLPGYYENIPSGTQGYPVTGSGSSTFVSGHFIKNDPGLGSIKQGDKIPCYDCHNPHLGYSVGVTNQAFIRPDLGGSIPPLTGVKASTNMAYTDEVNNNDPAHYDRDDADSRRFCIACHGTSEQASYQAVTFRDINSLYGTNYIAKPTTKISAHKDGNTTACTDCHRHNGVSYSCSTCHGFPPLRTIAEAGGQNFDKDLRSDVENYSGGAGAHRRHQDALGEAIFTCELCHGENPGSAGWHNEGSGSLTNGAKVNIMGLSAYWDPEGTRTNADYDGTANSPPATPAGYEFSKQGGGNQRCSNLACHGDPPDVADALNWTDKMVDETAGPYPAGDFLGDGASVCKWCHDGTPARIGTGPKAPNVMGDGTNWGADVNGHGKASGNYDADAIGGGGGLGAANKQCAVCHDARYETNPSPPPTNRPVKAHVDGTLTGGKRLRDSINGLTLTTLIDAQAPAVPDAACRACHQNGATGTGPEGTEVSTHGNHFNASVETAFNRACRQCHDVHGANWNGTGRNLHMIGKWVDSLTGGVQGTAEAGEEARVDSNAAGNAVDITTDDSPVIFTANTLEDSYDDGFGDSKHESVCVVCHADLVNNHNESTSTGIIGGPYDNNSHRNIGNDCIGCHKHESDNNVATADAFAPAGCEGCHNVNAYDPDGAGPKAAAPNVMGNGTSANGTGSNLKPFDDGSYGFNVNGHGRDNDTSGISNGNPIDKKCEACHDINLPAGAHLDGTLNGRLSPDTRNANSFHLNSSFIAASLTNQWTVQTTFDAACAGPVTGCHTANNQMRHALDAAPAANAAEFGTHDTFAAGPSNTPPPFMFFDRNLTNLSGIDTAPNYAPCVSCHDPHGTNTSSPRADGNNKMVIYRWANPSRLCVKCHH